MEDKLASHYKTLRDKCASDYKTFRSHIDLSKVTVSDELIMTFGGSTDAIEGIPNVYMYNVTGDSWAPGPTMKESRQKPVCGVIKDPASGKPVEIVVGGGRRGSGNAAVYPDTVEILNLDSMTWDYASTSGNMKLTD